ncbi:tetratricopeptide repeat protein [Burkholderia sp. 3C]
MSKPAAFVALVAFLAGVLRALACLLVEALAWWACERAGAHLDPFLAGLALQALAAAVQAWLLRPILPARYREPRRATLWLLWALLMFMPLVGGLLVLASCAWAAWFPAERENDRLAEVGRPEFITHLVSRVAHGGGARLQARLVNTQVSSTDRLTALVAIQSMPTRTTGSLLRELLADPVEDVRLIAYGTLDHAENEIMQKIYAMGQALAKAATDAERYALNRQLAELYFELIYQSLVQGAVYRHTLAQAERYARAALEVDERDAALWLILGRLALAEGRPDDAGVAMARALELGFPRERLTPWLAEVAFLRGDYALTRELLASLGNAAVLPTLKPIVTYWSR